MFFEQGLLDSVLEGELYQTSSGASGSSATGTACTAVPADLVGSSKASGERHSKTSERGVTLLVNGGSLKKDASGKGELLAIFYVGSL